MNKNVLHVSMDLDLGELMFDPENPRLPESVESEDEASVIEWLIKKTSLLDLVSSIAENGYFPGEPLLVVPSSQHGKYVVVEGNRRLASLKLIKKPELAPQRKRTLLNILGRGISTIEFDKIPVICFDDRDDILNYLGYRHVTGVKSWSPLAKSKYLYELRHSKMYRKVSEPEVFYELAYSIGSKGHYVKRFIVCYELFLKLVSAKFFSKNSIDIEDIEYSNFYDALSKKNIAKYVGLNFEKDHPVRDVSLPNLKRLVGILYFKNDLGETKLGESRNITKLNEVFGNKKAMDAFLSKDKTIRESLQLINNAESRLNAALINIVNEISLVKDAIDELSETSFDFKKKLDTIEKFIYKVRGL